MLQYVILVKAPVNVEFTGFFIRVDSGTRTLYPKTYAMKYVDFTGRRIRLKPEIYERIIAAVYYEHKRNHKQSKQQHPLYGHYDRYVFLR